MEESRFQRKAFKARKYVAAMITASSPWKGNAWSYESEAEDAVEISGGLRCQKHGVLI